MISGSFQNNKPYSLQSCCDGLGNLRQREGASSEEPQSKVDAGVVAGVCGFHFGTRLEEKSPLGVERGFDGCYSHSIVPVGFGVRS